MALDGLKKTSEKGVYYRTEPGRYHGVKLDRQFVIVYKLGGKKYRGVIGWESDGNKVSEAKEKIDFFRANFKAGVGPLSLSEEEALAALRRNEEQKAQEKQVQLEARRNTTVSDFFNNTYLVNAKADKAAETVRAEISYFTYWVKPVIGDLPLSEISIEHLDKIKGNMMKGKRGEAKKSPRSKQRNKAKPMSARSIVAALQVVRQMWNYAADMKPPLVTGQWPGASRQFKKPKIRNQRDRYLTHDEADRLLLKLKETSLLAHDLALLSLNTGMRFGEIAALTWRRVDLTKKLLRLPDTKNNEPRTIHLTDIALEMLRKRSVDTKGSPYVFPGADGEILKTVPSSYRRAVESLGFNKDVSDPRLKVCFHTLRHSFASWLVEQGEGIRLVGDLLGHKTLVMTKRYTHVSEEAQKAAIASLGKRLSPERGANVVDMEAAKKKAKGKKS